jgi:hypothetical protein
VPIYASGKVINAGSAAGLTFVAWETLDSAQQALKFYQGGLERNGWQVQTTTSSLTAYQVSAKKNRQSCFVLIVEDVKAGKTKISLQHDIGELQEEP